MYNKLRYYALPKQFLSLYCELKIVMYTKLQISLPVLVELLKHVFLGKV